MKIKTDNLTDDFDQQLRDMNAELLISSIRQQELTEEAERALAALAASEEKYRTLFESMDEGYCIIELIFNEDEQPVDYRFMEVNSAFERQAGMHDVVGRRMLEFVPAIEPHWLETYGTVARTGVPIRFTDEYQALSKWFDVYAFRAKGWKGQEVAVLFNDVTERKRSEANLAFFAEVSKDLVALTNIGSTMKALGAKIGAYFGATRLAFFEFNEAADEAVCEYDWHANADGVSLVGNFRTADFYTDANEFISTLRAGEAFVLGDGTADGRVLPESLLALDIRSSIVVPTDRDSWLPLSVLALNDNKARVWREDEIDLMRELTTRIWTRLERARTEEALAASEAKYRTLFNSTDQGFAIVEVIQDAHGTAIDCRYLEVNRAFNRQIGLSDVEGKLSSELFPQLESYWMEQFVGVIQTGEPIQFENYSVDTGRWFQANYTRVGGADSRLVGIVFDEITRRKRREANLAFLSEVSSDLANLTNIDETMNVLGVKIGAHFRASQCGFAELNADGATVAVTHDWHADDVPGIVGEYQIADYATEELLAAWRSGVPFILRDAKSDERVDSEALAAFKIASYISMPIQRDGEWRFLLLIYDRVARDWREDEIDLMRELTTRIWTRLERARAESSLAASEVKYRTLFKSIDEGFCVLEVLFDESGEAYDYVFHEANAAFERHSGLVGAVGRSILDLVPGMEPQWAKVYAQVAKTGEPIRFDANVESMNRVFDIYAFSDGTLGENRVAVVFNDITHRKRREQHLAAIASITAVLG